MNHLFPGIKWGEDLVRDCQEFKKLERWGIYPQGHHDMNCGLCLSKKPEDEG